MIWLASFPRSGNTFVRNILYEVYGIESSTFHYQTDYPIDPNYEKYEFVKTHELPTLIKPVDESIPAVYIIRDGRDAMVSMAHHRKDIIAPGSDFYQNLKEAIIADRGSFFGGWSTNVKQWIDRADILIRYEDLLNDPIAYVEKFRKIYDLPKPDVDKLPTFNKLKFGIPKYGASKDQTISEDEKLEKSKKFFRRGIKGGWKDEMPDELHDLFWSYHGETMERLGYSFDGEIVALHPDLDNEQRVKLDLPEPQTPERKYKVLIESNKIVSRDNDGVKRYQVELLKGLSPTIDNPFTKWHFDLFVNGEIIPLKNLNDEISRDFSNKDIEQGHKIKQKGKKSLFERAELFLVRLVPDNFVLFLQKKNITFFHKTYDYFKSIIINIVGFFIRLKTIIRLQLFKSLGLVPKFTGNSELDKKIGTYDLIHLPLPHHYSPFIHAKTNFITTVHDLTHIYYPEYHTQINIANSHAGIDFISQIGSDVIAVSESTRKDLLKEANIPPDKVEMIHEAADRNKFNLKPNGDDNRIVKKKYGILTDDPYLICLSTIEPRKNLENTIKGFILLLKENPEIPLNLVIAGKKGWESTKLFLMETSYKNRIIFTGFVDDVDIAALYSEAIAMSYLSFYEGFGLPPLEAMNCGTPIIYGNNSSLIEVVADGGIPADPEDINDIKDKFATIYFNKDLRDQKSRAALKQSLKFSWRKTVIETLKAYEKTISGDRNLNN